MIIKNIELGYKTNAEVTYLQGSFWLSIWYYGECKKSLKINLLQYNEEKAIAIAKDYLEKNIEKITNF